MAIYIILTTALPFGARTDGDKVVQPTLVLIISNVFAIISHSATSMDCHGLWSYYTMLFQCYYPPFSIIVNCDWIHIIFPYRLCVITLWRGSVVCGETLGWLAGSVGYCVYAYFQRYYHFFLSAFHYVAFFLFYYILSQRLFHSSIRIPLMRV